MYQCKSVQEIIFIYNYNIFCEWAQTIRLYLITQMSRLLHAEYRNCEYKILYSFAAIKLELLFYLKLDDIVHTHMNIII